MIFSSSAPSGSSFFIIIFLIFDGMIDHFHIFDKNVGMNGRIKIEKLVFIDNKSHIYIPISVTNEREDMFTQTAIIHFSQNPAAVQYYTATALLVRARK